MVADRHHRRGRKSTPPEGLRTAATSPYHGEAKGEVGEEGKVRGAGIRWRSGGRTASMGEGEKLSELEGRARIKRKLERVAFDLKIWSKVTFGKAKLQFHVANEVILLLDMEQENRRLSVTEFNRRKQLKLKVLGLDAIDRAIKKQASHITSLRAGDANSKLFHANIKSRERKNFIHSLSVGNREVFDHGEKDKLIHEHFAECLGKHEVRLNTRN
ncbi:Cellulose synthase-like protein D4 [Hordeum vulgare]|nr:Cellulose synthase-like protein D4 [Hordeum vulgare]